MEAWSSVESKSWARDCFEQNMRLVNSHYVRHDSPWHQICPNNDRRVTRIKPSSFALSQTQSTHSRLYCNGRTDVSCVFLDRSECYVLLTQKLCWEFHLAAWLGISPQLHYFHFRFRTQMPYLLTPKWWIIYRIPEIMMSSLCRMMYYFHYSTLQFYLYAVLPRLFLSRPWHTQYVWNLSIYFSPFFHKCSLLTHTVVTETESSTSLMRKSARDTILSQFHWFLYY
jgi:hypothetical protein